MVSTNYVVDGTVGINVTEISTTEDFTLGDRHTGNDGSTFVFVQANGAITADGYVVLIDETWQADMIDTTNSATGFGQQVGVARVAFADNDYGWVQISGVAQIRVLANAAANVQLNSTATVGVLDDDATSGAEEVGAIAATTAAGGAEATVEGYLSFPTVGTTIA